MHIMVMNIITVNSILSSHDGGWPHIPLNSGGVFLPIQNELVAIWDPGLYLE